MKKFLWAHIVLEGLGGILLFLYPRLLFYKGIEQTQAYPIIKMYGILAVSFAIAYIFLIRTSSPNTKLILQFYLLAMGFQLFLTFQCYSLLNSNYLSHKGAFYAHLTVFIILTIGYFLHRFDKAD